MLHTEVLRPPTLPPDADKADQQLHRYLIALAEQLQNVFDAIDNDDVRDQVAHNTEEIRRIASEMRRMAR